ncbi:hypothetical protein OESDEN_10326 [Oesophagostomum dentatum]|uniref:Uncharacterized protein n=1 Tax=Oesophagostomum dentatum TaxID=61180 RepID=A0A0B1SXX9_OESDE|nr:hypothetical protein OESDEN_10326 [Oesophagostomum dentatum]
MNSRALFVSLSVHYYLTLIAGRSLTICPLVQAIGNVGARCSDLILYPVSAVDQSDQYRFDYSDVSFGNTHAQGATVAITCTTGGQPATVEGYDQVFAA